MFNKQPPILARLQIGLGQTWPVFGRRRPTLADEEPKLTGAATKSAELGRQMQEVVESRLPERRLSKCLFTLRLADLA